MSLEYVARLLKLAHVIGSDSQTLWKRLNKLVQDSLETLSITSDISIKAGEREPGWGALLPTTKRLKVVTLAKAALERRHDGAKVVLLVFPSSIEVLRLYCDASMFTLDLLEFLSACVLSVPQLRQVQLFFSIPCGSFTRAFEQACGPNVTTIAEVLAKFRDLWDHQVSIETYLLKGTEELEVETEARQYSQVKLPEGAGCEEEA